MLYFTFKEKLLFVLQTLRSSTKQFFFVALSRDPLHSGSLPKICELLCRRFKGFNKNQTWRYLILQSLKCSVLLNEDFVYVLKVIRMAYSETMMSPKNQISVQSTNRSEWEDEAVTPTFFSQKELENDKACLQREEHEKILF